MSRVEFDAAHLPASSAASAPCVVALLEGAIARPSGSLDFHQHQCVEVALRDLLDGN